MEQLRGDTTRGNLRTPEAYRGRYNAQEVSLQWLLRYATRESVARPGPRYHCDHWSRNQRLLRQHGARWRHARFQGGIPVGLQRIFLARRTGRDPEKFRKTLWPSYGLTRFCRAHHGVTGLRRY